MKRSGKWYRKNEAEVMKSLGLKPTVNSGSTWVEKEDGQSDEVICQLKSTDAQSIRINQHDLHVLEYNASVSHKTPVFAIQFIQGNEVWLMVKPEDLGALQTITGVCGETVFSVDGRKADFEKDGEPYLYDAIKGDMSKVNREIITSSADARESYLEELKQKYEKKGKSAK